jgi:hypothetical protein
MLLIVVFPFLHMLNLDVHGEAFSHKLNLIAEPLDQYPCVTLDFIETIVMRVQPLLNRLKASIVSVEPLVDPVEPLVDLLKSLIDPVESYVERLKPSIEILNEFLIHTASSVSEG